MANNHYGGNIQPALDVEEHDGDNNAKRVRVVAGNITLDAGDIQIGAVEIKNATDDTRATVGANGLSVDVKALVALPAGNNNIGDVDVVSSVLPTDAATQTTLALIKAKTDNIDVALSTRAVTGLTDAQLRATAVPVSATVSGAVDTELPAAAALADATANPTTPGVGIYPHDFNGTTWDRRRHSFTQTTTGITAASNGTAIDMTTDPQKIFAITAKMQGDTSTFDVRLEGSLDNTNFAELVAITNITPGDGKLGFAIDKPILYVRYRVAGLTRATGTLDIKILATE